MGCAQAVSQLLGQGKSGGKKSQKNPNQGTAVVQYSLCTGNSLCVKPGGKEVHEWLIPHPQPATRELFAACHCCSSLGQLCTSCLPPLTSCWRHLQELTPVFGSYQQWDNWRRSAAVGEMSSCGSLHTNASCHHSS